MAEHSEVDSLWPVRATDLDDDLIAAGFAPGLSGGTLPGDRSRPWLRVNFVSSVDGAATHNGRSGGLSGDADKRVFDILRRLCHVVLVGAGTVRDEGYGPMRLDQASVDWRLASGLAAHPVFAIVSGRLDLDPASRIFTEAPVRPIVVTTERSPHDRRQALAEVAEVLVCGGEELDVEGMLAALAQRGLVKVHCEGGPTLFGALIAADAVDELCLTVSPQLEAGDARRIATGTLPAARQLQLAQVLVSGDTLLLRYTRRVGAIPG
ncbi:MAG: pyrimidine reductase family protein [Lacisediminihabitans sp.]